jgi:hypothetical protein
MRFIGRGITNKTGYTSARDTACIYVCWVAYFAVRFTCQFPYKSNGKFDGECTAVSDSVRFCKITSEFLAVEYI